MEKLLENDIVNETKSFIEYCWAAKYTQKAEVK